MGSRRYVFVAVAATLVLSLAAIVPSATGAAKDDGVIAVTKGTEVFDINGGAVATFRFEPEVITVASGTKVTWKHLDTSRDPHTITIVTSKRQLPHDFEGSNCKLARPRTRVTSPTASGRAGSEQGCARSRPRRRFATDRTETGRECLSGHLRSSRNHPLLRLHHPPLDARNDQSHLNAAQRGAPPPPGQRHTVQVRRRLPRCPSSPAFRGPGAGIELPLARAQGASPRCRAAHEATRRRCA
jgi:plastocyanin